ncbi:ABC transporter permease [Romboutsia sedimentorum]|uniref:ABC transporter permease n=1 Tax=Romboutsia sedimentorum TaxID=1368474 RepID=UPI0024DE8E4D|nr:ABC transporter permease [Romboutsia sedimentorum]MDK2587342.1 ABC transporter permease [Romboutsia sedimentorum]
MILFEIKKVFSKSINKLTLLILIVLLIAVSILTINKVEYVDENGNNSTGIIAAKKLRDAKNKWAGYITEDVLIKVIKENTKINTSKEALSKDYQENDKAYSKMQGFLGISGIISDAFGKYDDYDYYRVNSVATKEVGKLYEKRILNFKEWLNSGEENFSLSEKNFLINKYEQLKTPFYYEYVDGWNVLLQNISTFILILALVISVFVAGIFSDEFQLKADSIFFSTKLGRNKAIRSKIGAGLLIITVAYVIFTGLYTMIVLSVLGFDGAKCPIQFSMWKSIYNITYFQAYLLIVLGGYVGTLFAMTLCMIVSAKTHSTVIAIIVPFIILCGLPFLSRIITLPQICSAFPDQLLQVYVNIKEFVLYDIGGIIIDSVSIIIPVYMIASIILQPVIYSIYKRSEVK